MINHVWDTPPKNNWPYGTCEPNNRNPLSTDAPNPSATNNKKYKPVDEASKKQTKEEKNNSHTEGKPSKKNTDPDKQNKPMSSPPEKEKKLSSAKSKAKKKKKDTNSSSNSTSLAKLIKKARQKSKKKHQGSQSSRSTLSMLLDLLESVGVDNDEEARITENLQSIFTFIAVMFSCAVLLYIVIELHVYYGITYGKQKKPDDANLAKLKAAQNDFEKNQRNAVDSIKKKKQKDEKDKKEMENNQNAAAAEEKRTAIVEFDEIVNKICETFTPKIDIINENIAANTPIAQFRPGEEIRNLILEAKNQIDIQFLDQVLQAAGKSKPTLYDENFGELFKKLPPEEIIITGSEYKGKWTNEDKSVNCTYQLVGVKNKSPFYKSITDGKCKNYSKQLEFYYDTKSNIWIIVDTNYAGFDQTILKMQNSYPWNNVTLENYPINFLQQKAHSTSSDVYKKDGEIKITANYMY